MGMVSTVRGRDDPKRAFGPCHAFYWRTAALIVIRLREARVPMAWEATVGIRVIYEGGRERR